MPLILGANSVSGGYEIDNSLRFDVASTDFLIRTIASTGSNQIWTASGWTKRQQLGASSSLYCSSDTSAGNNFRSLFINASDQVQCAFIAGTYTFQVETNALLRDVSAWYHIVAAVDTTQATSTDRVKIWINGVLQTSFATASYPSQNATINFSTSGYKQLIASLRDSSTILNGCYLAEMHILDGVAKQASDFGETDQDTNIWIPKAYTGSFGTNGFYLEFQNSGALGTDSSGNGNTFTVNNLTSVDQSTDTPTNNFATLNPLANFRAGATLTEGNLKASLTTTKAGVPATVGVSTGKWYWENKIDTLPVDGRFGIGIVPFEPVEADDFYNANNKGIGLSGFNSIIYASGTGIDDFYGNATGRWSGFTGIIGVALDLSSGTKTIAMSRDGAWITGSNTTDSVFANALKVDITSYVNAYDFWNPIIGSSNGSSTTGVISLNFGSPSFTIASGNTDGAGFGNFEYAVPSGYYSLNTKNLADYG